MPKNKYTSNGGELHTKPYSQNEVLLDFSCEQDIEFETLLPLYKTPLVRVFMDPRFNSTSDVARFVMNMPVKEMHNLYDGICSGKEESVHNVLWMMQWLETSMEISEITRPMLRSYIHYLNANLMGMGTVMDCRVEEFIAMRADISVDADTIEKHRLEGFKTEIRYHRLSRLSLATDIVDMLADYLVNKLPRCVCKYDKCAYYRSPQWFMDQPCGLAPQVVPKTNAHQCGVAKWNAVVVKAAWSEHIPAQVSP